MKNKLIILVLILNSPIFQLSSLAQDNALDFFINQVLVHSPVATRWFYAIHNYFASASLIIRKVNSPYLAKLGKYDV